MIKIKFISLPGPADNACQGGFAGLFNFMAFKHVNQKE
jgi:hypothetical protein